MGFALSLGMTTRTPRSPRSPFTNASRRRAACGFLLATALGLAVLGCDDGGGAGTGAPEEAGGETSSSEGDVEEPMDSMGEGEALPDLGDDGGDGDVDSPPDGDGGDGDGAPDEPDICGDGIVGPTEECDVGIYELMPCEAGPGSLVCKPNCTLSEAFCECELGTDGCLCTAADSCEPGLECCEGTGVHVCRPAPTACIERLEPCISAADCCGGLSCSPDSAGLLVCQ